MSHRESPGDRRRKLARSIEKAAKDRRDARARLDPQRADFRHSRGTVDDRTVELNGREDRRHDPDALFVRKRSLQAGGR